jgi:hypothetical protein
MPRPPPSRAIALALAAALMSAAGPAAAQKPAAKPTPSWADKATAQRLLREGNQAVGEGDYTAALAKFEAANARYPSPKLLVNIGTTLRLLGRYPEAAAAFETYLADPAAEKTRVAEINRALKEIDALVGRLEIVVKEPDARVRLDGKELSGWKSGDVLRVNPGEHTVVAERPGLPPAVQTLRIAGAEARQITLEFTPPQRVVITPPSPQRPIGIVVGSVGAAGLLAFAVTASLALVSRKAVDGHCFPGTTVCDQQGLDLSHRARTLGNASTGLLIGGAALLGTGLTLFFTARRDAPQAGSWRLLVGLGEGRLEGTW